MAERKRRRLAAAGQSLPSEAQDCVGAPLFRLLEWFESLVATTLDNVERTNLMKLLAAEYAALDQLARRPVRTRARLAKRLA